MRLAIIHLYYRVVFDVILTVRCTGLVAFEMYEQESHFSIILQNLELRQKANLSKLDQSKQQVSGISNVGNSNALFLILF